MTTYNTLRVLGLLMLTLCPATAHSQVMSDAEMAEAVAVMRATGQSEEQVQQFLDAMKMIERMPALDQSQSPSKDPSADIQAITGMSDADMRVVNPIADSIMDNQSAWMAEQLEKEQATFAARYADKPDAHAVFDGQPLNMKLLRCRLTQAYDFEAQGPPTRHSEPGPAIVVSRGWSVANQGWVVNITLRLDDEYHRAALPTTALSGTTFSYSGLVTADSNAALETKLTFSATCHE